MKADNKIIQNWLSDIRQGVLRLPRFQRKEAWDHNHVGNFLNAVIIRGRPVGVLLTLEVDSKHQPFKTRPLEGTEHGDNGNCRLHLLDGQQRLTALWKSLNNKYPDKQYFIEFDPGKLEEQGYWGEQVRSVTVKSNPWVDSPKKTVARHYLPVHLLNPETALRNISNWIEETRDTAPAQNDKLRNFALRLWERLSNIQIPFLSLPQSTAPEDAIDIFIHTNTSFVRLTPYDIAVAQFEAETGDSLRDMVEEISEAVPAIVALAGENDVGDLVLKIACLLQGRKPTYGNYDGPTMEALKKQQGVILDGIKWAAKVMGGIKIWRQAQLPSAVPLRVLPALFQHMPKRGDDKARADRLISRYVWRSFFTSRYERQANDRLYVDYGELRKALTDKTYQCAAEIFAEKLPDEEDLRTEVWPKNIGIRKRAILAISNQGGARDIASNEEIGRDQTRDYHHIFPKDLFKKHNATECNPDLALNCMLIDGFTNRQWKDKWPGVYILARIEHSGLKGKKAREELRRRLRSHLLPEEIIIGAVENNGKSLEDVYNEFLQQRAKLVVDKMKQLCDE